MTSKRASQVVAAWAKSGMVVGLAIGGGYGALAGMSLGGPTGPGMGIGLLIGAFIGAFIGVMAGLSVGVIDGLLLAWSRPAPSHAPLAAAVATEVILLPAQAWLWFVIHPVAFLPLVAAPSAVSIGMAAMLGLRLPPGAG